MTPRTLAVSWLAASAIFGCRTAQTKSTPTTDLPTPEHHALRQLLQNLGNGGGIPEKRDPAGQIVRPDRSRFDQISQEDYLAYRDRHRRMRVICETRDTPESCSLSTNLTRSGAEQILNQEAALINNMETIEQLGLDVGQSTYQPWSTGHWFPQNGFTAYRYSDPAWPTTGTWNDRHSYASRTKTSEHLSPAEKYDLAMEANQETLMQSQWSMGQPSEELSAEEDLLGDLAHGWAAASITLPRPTRSVPVQITSSESIIFQPEDLKALASLLWAHNRYPIRYVGGPCLAHGEIRNAKENCQTFDAATFHVAIVNAIGVAKQPLIMDATLDPDIFHRPIVSYSMKFFSVGNQELSETYAAANKSLPTLGDPWASQRSQSAKSVVGVATTLTFVTQRQPVAEETDSADSDELMQVTYIYDLELNANGEILTGIWYQDVHPDFLWRPEPDQTLTTWGDDFVRGNWSYDQGELPWSWKKGGEYDARSGKPLGKFVASLFEVAAGVQALSQRPQHVGFSMDGQDSCRPHISPCPVSPKSALTSTCYAIGAQIYTCEDCRLLCSQPVAPLKTETGSAINQ